MTVTPQTIPPQSVLAQSVSLPTITQPTITLPTVTPQSISLQVALDRIPIDRAEELTSAVRDHADWIEVGTSLVKRYGMPGVARIVAAAGGVPVLADLKTADDARTELTMAADAGARSVTVLGLASPATLGVAASVAAECDLELMIDLMELDEAGSGARRRGCPTLDGAGGAHPQGCADRQHRPSSTSRRLGVRASARPGRRPRRP